MSIVGFPWRSRFATIFRRPGPEAYAAMLKRAQRLGPTLPPDRKLAPKAGPACPLSREQRQSTGSRARAPTELGYSVVGPTGHEGRQAPRLLPNRGECTTRRIFSPPPQRHGCVVTAAAAALLLLEQGRKKRITMTPPPHFAAAARVATPFRSSIVNGIIMTNGDNRAR